MWTIFKVLIEFVTILFHFQFWFFSHKRWHLSSLTRDLTHTPCIGKQSLNTRKVPRLFSYATFESALHIPSTNISLPLCFENVFFYSVVCIFTLVKSFTEQKVFNFDEVWFIFSSFWLCFWDQVLSSSLENGIKRRLLLRRKAVTNLDSLLRSRGITLPTKVHLVKAVVFPVVMYGCESWTIKKAEHWRTDAFEV